MSYELLPQGDFLMQMNGFEIISGDQVSQQEMHAFFRDQQSDVVRIQRIFKYAAENFVCVRNKAAKLVGYTYFTISEVVDPGALFCCQPIFKTKVFAECPVCTSPEAIEPLMKQVLQKAKSIGACKLVVEYEEKIPDAIFMKVAREAECNYKRRKIEEGGEKWIKMRYYL